MRRSASLGHHDTTALAGAFRTPSKVERDGARRADQSPKRLPSAGGPASAVSKGLSM